MLVGLQLTCFATEPKEPKIPASCTMRSVLLFPSAPFDLVAHLDFVIPVAHKVQLLGLIVLRDPTPSVIVGFLCVSDSFLEAVL